MNKDRSICDLLNALTELVLVLVRVVQKEHGV
jgi:hypothetical protein